MRRLLALLWLLCVSVTTRAAVIDTVAVFSARMQREIPAFVVIPEHAAGERLPVVYLLHGFGNNQRAWLQITDLRSLSERYRMIFVCPDGEKSWYWDSPLHAESQFETFISGELPAWIDARYPTIAAREGRAITGLSMGLWEEILLPYHHHKYISHSCFLSAFLFCLSEDFLPIL